MTIETMFRLSIALVGNDLLSAENNKPTVGGLFCKESGRTPPLVLVCDPL